MNAYCLSLAGSTYQYSSDSYTAAVRSVQTDPHMNDCGTTRPLTRPAPTNPPVPHAAPALIFILSTAHSAVLAPLRFYYCPARLLGWTLRTTSLLCPPAR